MDSFEIQEYETIIERLKKILDVSSEDPEVYFLLGRFYHKLKDYPSALLFYRLSDSNIQKNFSAYSHLSRLLYDVGQKEEAQRLLERINLFLEDAQIAEIISGIRKERIFEEKN